MKKPYETPVLLARGTVEKLTRGGILRSGPQYDGS
jgi:hypothetical protein